MKTLLPLSAGLSDCWVSLLLTMNSHIFHGLRPYCSAVSCPVMGGMGIVCLYKFINSFRHYRHMRVTSRNGRLIARCCTVNLIRDKHTGCPSLVLSMRSGSSS